MAIEKSTVYLPTEIFPLLEDLAHGKNDDENVIVSLAVGLFLSKTVSLARAAEIAKLSLNDFIETLRLKGLSWCEYDDYAHNQDLSTIKSLLGTIGASNA